MIQSPKEGEESSRERKVGRKRRPVGCMGANNRTPNHRKVITQEGASGLYD